MNSEDRGVVLHCLKSMIDEAVCEECPLYGMTGTDHCEKDCVRLAINELEQEDEYIKVPKKALKYRTAGMVAYNVEWLKKHFDTERAVICGAQEPCEMTAEEYRQRMIQAFHNADCDELIALVVLPTEKEFEHLGWLLEKHYKAKPEHCDDCISRQEVLNTITMAETRWQAVDNVNKLPPVTPQPKMGRWIPVYKGLIMTSYKCSECGRTVTDDTGYDVIKDYPFCNCGAKMQEVEDNGQN